MKPHKLFSLVFVRRNFEILLGLKKRGFGKGKWNGFGGKIEPGETIYEGAIRELHEECGIIASHLEKVGILDFDFVEGDFIYEVHVFKTNNYEGKVTESEEMQPKWYNLKDIPFDKMWVDDVYWFPYMLQGKIFKGYVLYQDQDVLLKHDIQIMEELPADNVL